MSKFKGLYEIGLRHDDHPMSNATDVAVKRSLKKYGIIITEAEDDEVGLYSANIPIYLAKVIDHGGEWRMIVPYRTSYIEITCESP